MNNKHHRNVYLLLAAMLVCNIAAAQPGLDEMREAQQSLKDSFFSALNCSLVLAALLGIAGAIRIYHNWQMGHPRIDQAVAAWFFAALFMILAGTFLQAIFGI